MKEYFEEISDQRQPWKVKHNLLEIIITTICAVVSGCEIWEDITYFCRVKKSWFEERLELRFENGIASHDTYQRVFSMIKPEELEKSFEAWTNFIRRKIEREVVSIDGKTMCGSRDISGEVAHIVGAWANQNQLALGQVKTEAKSNEITAIPNLLELLDVSGCIVTTDAMGCQKEIASKIVKGEADYVLAVKGNQPRLYEDIRDYFASVEVKKNFSSTVCKLSTKEKGHGRIESRRYCLETDIAWLETKGEWKSLHSIGMVHSVVERNGKISEETRYFISSLNGVEEFARAVRSHWGVENNLHWCLDVVFREDHSRMRKDNTAQNFTVVRRLALNMLKGNPEKMSLKRKQRRCEYDSDFLAQVLFGSTS